MKTIALSLTTLLMAASSTASAPPTMGSLAIQDAPLEGSLVLSDQPPVTNTNNQEEGQSDGQSFYWVDGQNKCANFELNSGDIPYVKKNCRIYQEGTCASQGYTVAAHVGSYYGEQFEHLKNIYPKQIIFNANQTIVNLID